MGPVFLFDMGIVIFVISPAAGKGYRLFTFCEMAQEMIVEKLTAHGLHQSPGTGAYIRHPGFDPERLFLLYPGELFVLSSLWQYQRSPWCRQTCPSENRRNERPCRLQDNPAGIHLIDSC